MLPRQAVRELSIAAAVVLVLWSGLPQAFVRASWAPLRPTRVFLLLCVVAAALLLWMWNRPPRRVEDGAGRSDDQAA